MQFEKTIKMLTKKGHNEENIRMELAKVISEGKEKIIDFLYLKAGLHYVRGEKIANDLIS